MTNKVAVNKVKQYFKDNGDKLLDIALNDKMNFKLLGISSDESSMSYILIFNIVLEFLQFAYTLIVLFEIYILYKLKDGQAQQSPADQGSQTHAATQAYEIRVWAMIAKIFFTIGAICRTIKAEGVPKVQYFFAFINLILPFPGVHLLTRDIRARGNQKKDKYNITKEREIVVQKINQRKIIVLQLIFTHIFDFYPEIFTVPVLRQQGYTLFFYSSISLVFSVWILGYLWCVILEVKSQTDIWPDVEKVIHEMHKKEHKEILKQQKRQQQKSQAQEEQKTSRELQELHCEDDGNFSDNMSNLSDIDAYTYKRELNMKQETKNNLERQKKLNENFTKEVRSFREACKISKLTIMSNFAACLSYISFDVFVVNCWMCPSDELKKSSKALKAKLGIDIQILFPLAWGMKMLLGFVYTAYRFWYSVEEKDRGQTDATKGFCKFVKAMFRMNQSASHEFNKTAAKSSSSKNQEKLKNQTIDFINDYTNKQRSGNSTLLLEKNNCFNTIMSIEMRNNPYILFAILTMPCPAAIFSFVNMYEGLITMRRFSWFEIIKIQKLFCQVYIGNYVLIIFAMSQNITDFHFNPLEQQLLYTSLIITATQLTIQEFEYLFYETSRCSDVTKLLKEQWSIIKKQAGPP